MKTISNEVLLLWKKYIGMVMKVGREEYFHKGGQEDPLWGGNI